MPRPKIEQLSKDAAEKARQVLGYIAPHVPASALSDVIVAESAINFALQQAEYCQSQFDALRQSVAPEPKPIVKEYID